MMIYQMMIKNVISGQVPSNNTFVHQKGTTLHVPAIIEKYSRCTFIGSFSNEIPGVLSLVDM